MSSPAPIDDIDRAIIRATQDGLPLVRAPYAAVGEVVGISADEVVTRMTRMLESGVIRRIGAVPNHYALGFRGNGMTVWDVDDAHALDLGRLVGELDFVSHAYLRPRHLPGWPYNLFAMAHGRDRAEVEAKADTIRTLLGPHCRGGEILFSTRILKKTGLRLVA
ncbi:Lrp/AsnC family transcriptional regulator [Magnetovibrio sp.]|uniref:siroheme decarboxylase subunit beta n=1 Tax=Magnetovibrio sp. TaxID=2024836 RepID=UPI002F945053